jgi:hypothetical protein
MANERQVRVKRTPVSGFRNVLTYSAKDPGYIYRWVNDLDTRIQMFQEAGYEFIPTGEGQVGDKRVGTATELGSVVSKPVGNNTTAYLMRIKQEWYEEDQQKKLDHIKRQERDMADAADSLSNGYGRGVKFE